ncbi:MAG: DUF4861 family protein [Candidatus Marinimicrobia bacterium]|nr:DUF4861 family protein [Candidatus Neomarinimicrobiota bacterium]
MRIFSKSYLLVSLICLFAIQCQQSSILKDYPYSIGVTGINEIGKSRKNEAIYLPINSLKDVDKRFNPNACVVISDGVEIPHQIVDVNVDGVTDYMVLLVNFKPKEKKKIKIYFKDSGKVEHNYPRRAYAEISHKFGGKWEGRLYKGGEFKNVKFVRVPPQHTDHSTYFRYEGPGWESDRVGYRLYLDWRNSIDIFGKKTRDMILMNVGLKDFESYHNMSDWGMDIFKVGESLGIGTLGMYYQNKVHKVSNTDSVLCWIVSDGPIMAQVKIKYYGWKVGNNKYDVETDLSITGGTRLTRYDIRLDRDVDNLCTGLAKCSNCVFLSSSDGGWNYIALYGKQSLAGDNLGTALIYNKKNMVNITEDDLNHIVRLKTIDKSLRFYFLAAWEQEPDGIKNIKQFESYLEDILEKLNSPIKIRIGNKEIKANY